VAAAVSGQRRRHLKAVDAVDDALAESARGRRDEAAHGERLGEVRFIEVSVRGQMDGIRPIESAVLTYAWNPPVGEAVESWTFEGMQTRVQGLDGTLKAGTPLGREEFALLGPALGWAWDLVHAMRPGDGG
jgi:hypothetical protein